MRFNWWNNWDIIYAHWLANRVANLCCDVPKIAFGSSGTKKIKNTSDDKCYCITEKITSVWLAGQFVVNS